MEKVDFESEDSNDPSLLELAKLHLSEFDDCETFSFENQIK